MFRAIAATGIVAAGIGLSAAGAQATEIMICANNNAGVVGKYNLTLYTGNRENRRDTGENQFGYGDTVCWKGTDVRALNVTIWGWTTKWVKVCDINKRPGENLNVRMKGTVFDLSCAEY